MVNSRFLFRQSDYISTLGIPTPIWFEGFRAQRSVRGIRVGIAFPKGQDVTLITDVLDDDILLGYSGTFSSTLSHATPEQFLKENEPSVREFVTRRIR